MANSDKKQLILNPDESFSFAREVRITADGSATIFLPDINENYHSTNGAIQESMHVFIEAGLKQIQDSSIKIFEVGFGTGLNCLLTVINSSDKQIFYHAIEKFPVEDGLIQQLNYSEKLTKNIADEFSFIHKCSWNNEVQILPGFIFRKILGDLSGFIPLEKYNLIYFDAFAPEVQPELWSKAVFQKMFDMMESGGILITYCAKGEVRRIMQSVGFSVERLPGPPGKREMLRAGKRL